MPIATELAINTGADALTMAQTIFGSGVTVGTATLTGASGASGTFSGGIATLGSIAPADSGIILSTGNAADFTNSSGTTNTNTSAGTSTGNNTAGDSLLNGVSGQTTFDAVVLEATFTPDGDYITMQFTFSSEEYLEYVNSGFSDSLGVWVNDNFIPVTPIGEPVSIDTVNTTSNSNLYVNNPANTDPYNTEMDGFTVSLSFKAPVNSGVTNTIKIALGDEGDGAYDTNILIAGDSLQTVALAFDDHVTLAANSSRVVDVLANDVDDLGDGLQIIEIAGQSIAPGETITLGTGEQITLNLDGTLTITSDGDITTSLLTYTIENGDGTTDIGYLTIDTVAAPPPDGIVDGTASGELIGAGYLGDPDGDLIDAGDATGVMGTSGDDDVIQGWGGDDTVFAGGGNDIVYGGEGADSLSGETGDDTIYGGTGADTLIGGTGDDALTGGEGDDVFVYAPGDGLDTITDFNDGNSGGIDDDDASNNDSIDLSGYYDHISELYADQADDGILNQSNTTDTRGRAVDYSDNTQFGSGEGLVFDGAVGDETFFTEDNTGVVCFTPGTTILTPKGEVPIERLRAGDLVMTRDNGIKPILWIGIKRLGPQDLAAAPGLRPVQLQAGHFGLERELIVSPQHGVLLHPRDVPGDELLFRATHLAKMPGGAARVKTGARSVTYIHLLFERHEVIWSNGIPTESFYPGPMAYGSLDPGPLEELQRLFPELTGANVAEVIGTAARKYSRRGALPKHLKALASAA
jgi:hypothetical protein